MLTNPFTSLRAGVIHCRENLELMRELPEKAIDLIHIDARFLSDELLCGGCLCVPHMMFDNRNEGG